MSVLYVIYDENEFVRKVTDDYDEARTALQKLVHLNGSPRLEVYGNYLAEVLNNTKR